MSLCQANGAKRLRSACGVVTFIHLSFCLSAAVISATGGSLLCLGNQGVLSTGKAVAVSGRMHAVRKTASSCLISIVPFYGS